MTVEPAHPYQVPGIRPRHFVAACLTMILVGCGAIDYVAMSTLPPPPRTTDAIDYMRSRQYEKAFDLLCTRAALADPWANAYVAGMLGDSSDISIEIRRLIRDRLDRIVAVTAGAEPWSYPANVPMEVRRRFRDRMDEAIAKGDAGADYMMAMKYLNGSNSVQDLPQALDLLDRAAARQHRGALFILEQMDRRVLETRGLTRR